jgi:hypothetical protein
LLDEPVVSLHYVIQVLTLVQPAAAQGAFGVELLDRSRISRVLVDIDDPGCGFVDLTQDLTKEAFGGCRVSLSCQQEVDRLAGGVHGAV